MRRVVIVLAGCGLAGPAAAQSPPPATVAPNLFSMPGVPVGTGVVVPVGNQIAKSAPQVGSKVGTGPGGIPAALNPGGPQFNGQAVDPKNVVAPYPGQPQPAPSFWDQLEQRWLGMFQPAPVVTKTTNWTPGLARRNRERREKQMGRLD